MKVNITAELKEKLNILSTEYAVELSGFLLGDIRDKEIYLYDIIIPNQTITSSTFEISPAQQIEMLKKYGRKKCKKIIGVWHSHCSMGCFWSAIDLDNIRNMMINRDLFVFIVSSKGEHLIKVCIRSPIDYDIDEANLYTKTTRLDLLRKRVCNIIDNNTPDENKFDYEETSKIEVGDAKTEEEVVEEIEASDVANDSYVG